MKGIPCSVLLAVLFVLVLAEGHVEPVGHGAEEIIVVAGSGFFVEVVPEFP